MARYCPPIDIVVVCTREGADWGHGLTFRPMRSQANPAEYEWVEKHVEIQGPSEQLEVVPAKYEWVEERLMVSPASSYAEVVPPVYETVKERVVDRPAHTVWKKGRGPLERIDHATGEIMCLVEVPATYKTVTKRGLKSPSTTRVVEVPAQYQTVKKCVMKTPPKPKWSRFQRNIRPSK